MLKYYRELPATEKPTTDYSHPQKIYVALVSLFMVGEDYREVEVREMRDFGFIVSQVKKLN